MKTSVIWPFNLFPAELQHYNYDTENDGITVFERIEHLR